MDPTGCLYDRRGDLWLFPGGENTQFRASDGVPVASAREALAENLRTGSRPTAIDWDDIPKR